MLGAQVAVALVRRFLARLHETALAAAVRPAQTVRDGDLGARAMFAARAATVRPADTARLGALRAAVDRAARVAAVFPAQSAVLRAAVAVVHRAAFATAVANAQAAVHDVLFTAFGLADARLALLLELGLDVLRVADVNSRQTHGRHGFGVRMEQPGGRTSSWRSWSIQLLLLQLVQVVVDSCHLMPWRVQKIRDGRRRVDW